MSESRNLKVTKILPETEESASGSFHAQPIRVAAYCRVSTNSEEQLSSYQSQVEYYHEKIKINPAWVLVRIYADQGSSGTATKGRKEFNRMIRACRQGKIDLIITKSVSRFVRNTLDGLDYIRQLKELGIGVYFEKENINTLTLENELVLTFMMSAAQAESESLSGNIKWGIRKNFKDGKVNYIYSNFLGYREGPDGQPEIDPEEAELVRRIFSRYLQGQSVAKIITDFEAEGIKTIRGKEKWRDGVVRHILSNEKYMGDALLQKTFISDLFTRRSVKNVGQLPRYYVHDCHPAIIDKDTFYRVQEEIARRASLPQRSIHGKTGRSKHSGKYALSNLLTCGNCGALYRRVTWTRPEGKKIVWRCLRRIELGKKTCDSPTVEEGVVHDAIANRIKSEIDFPLLQEALLDAAQLASDAAFTRAALEELFSQRLTLEYDDILARQLIQKVVVIDEDRFEIEYK
ncbi:recombinase family protein [Oscillibacter sp.]|uniref:recombinase family protein n=1 Tax=Oscillibacter sp. TaxID=1945593 RepID=UPI0028A1AAE0|nr:recombinase family protein [Oscillibacter sp.]